MSQRAVTARLVLLPTTKGGRSGPLLSGYRSLLRFEGTEVDFGFEVELDPEAESSGIAPGAFGTGRLSFWATEHLPVVVPGQRFELREGTRVVGHGMIIDPHPT
jgi:translation elongation factor EF-Tu-like GTPase